MGGGGGGGREGESGGSFTVYYFIGQHLRLLCDAMVSIATSTGDMWSDVAPTLTAHLSHQTHQLPQLLVSTWSHRLGVWWL